MQCFAKLSIQGELSRKYIVSAMIRKWCFGKVVFTPVCGGSQTQKVRKPRGSKAPLLLLYCSSWPVLHPRKHMLSNQQLWQLLLWPNTWQRSRISATFPFVLPILVLTIWFCLLEGTDREQLCQEYFQIRLLDLMLADGWQGDSAKYLENALELALG